MSTLSTTNIKHPSSASNNIVLDSAGRVGVGTASPSQLLTVQTSGTSTTAGGNVAARIESNGSGRDVTLQFSDNVANSATISMVGSATAFAQAGTEQMRITSAGNLQFNSGYGSVATAYGCRAWVTFRDSSGTPTIAEDGNVSTIGDNGTGDYTINFSTAMPDTNYCVVGTLGADGTSFGGSALGGYMLKAFNTGSIRVLAGYGTSLIANDWQHNCIAVFR